jgi:phage-related protein
MDFIRDIKIYENHFSDFYNQQTQTVKEKIDEVLYFIRVIQRLNTRFLKHIEGVKGLYEIRVMVGTNIYRIFCTFDEGNLVILFNGFQKKEQKTPKKEIEMAKKIMKAYFEKKIKSNENIRK